MSETPLQVLIANDHALVSEVLHAAISGEHDLVVCGIASAPDDIAPSVEREQPDVLVLDPQVCRSWPADLVRTLRDGFPGLHIVIVAGEESPLVVTEMLRLGVAGYLCRGATREQIVTAIRGSRDGLTVIGAGSSGTSTLTVGAMDAEQATAETTDLSEREHEVLALVGEALSNRQVARRLSITEGTVKRHMRNIFEKLGVSSRMAAVRVASGPEVGTAGADVRRLAGI